MTDVQNESIATGSEDKPRIRLDETLSPGKMLRSAREQAGVEVEVLATTMKVPPQRILELENDDLSNMPGVFFARGLAANICRFLGVEAQPVLARMPSDKPHIHTDDESINAPISNSRFGAGMRAGMGLPLWAIAAVVALAIGAVLLFLLPTFSAKWEGTSVETASAPASAADAAPAVVGQLAPAPAAATTLAPAPTLAPASAVAPAATTLQPAAAVGTTLTPASAAASAPVVSSSTGLVFRASGETWVQVRNQNNRTVFERTLAAGEEQTVPVDTYPIRVTIGRAENIQQLLDRGQTFDLAGVARTGVARFQIQ